MAFMLGCNYWASNAGAEMWRDFNAEVIKNDIEVLSNFGIEYIRAFPNWRDFQPVIPIISCEGRFVKYIPEDEKTCKNPYFLDDKKLDEFSVFLDICEKYNMKVIVGLITGWMSGGLFIPAALYGKNLITDPVALYFQQLFIKGFVSRFKNSKSIFAWDLGNECNCLAPADRFSAVTWTAMISNAIKAEDPSREVFSGMHGLDVERDKSWLIKDQAMYTDMLTTHPYPYWGAHSRNDKYLSLRTTMYATAQTKYYAEIGQKPCLVEEIGTMGPMLCSDENSADYLRINMFSLWANNAAGVMWWCANDQNKLYTFPYTENMCEVELGMLDENFNAKPVIKEMKHFSNFLKSLNFKLPKAETDAVCLLTLEQRQWGIGYMTYVLLRKIGLNCEFAYIEGELPDSQLYILPSVNGVRIMDKTRYDQLKTKVYEGADLYISIDKPVLSDFEEFVGLKALDFYEHFKSGVLSLNGEQIPYQRNHNFDFEPSGASIIAYDTENNPMISIHNYGKGRVIFVSYPLENNLVDMHNAFSGKEDLIYKTVFKEYIDKRPVKVNAENVVITYHPAEDGTYVVIINHSSEDKNPMISIDSKYEIENIYYGSNTLIKAYDAAVFKFKKID